jgi:hypothetical protein
MAAFDFPASPGNGQQYTANGVTYTYSTADGAWQGGPVAPIAGYQPLDGTLTALATIPDANAGYPLLDGAGGAAARAAATTAEFFAATADKPLENDNVWAAAAEVSFAFTGTLTLPMNTFVNAVVPTISGDLTFGAPTGLIPGRSGVVRLSVTAGSPVNATWDASIMFVAGSKPATLKVGDNLLFYYTQNSKLYCSMGFSYA